MDREGWRAVVHGVAKSRTPEVEARAQPRTYELNFYVESLV